MVNYRIAPMLVREPDGPTLHEPTTYQHQVMFAGAIGAFVVAAFIILLVVGTRHSKLERVPSARLLHGRPQSQLFAPAQGSSAPVEAESPAPCPISRATHWSRWAWSIQVDRHQGSSALPCGVRATGARARTGATPLAPPITTASFPQKRPRAVTAPHGPPLTLLHPSPNERHTAPKQDDVDAEFAAEFRGNDNDSQNLVTPASISFENIGLKLKKKGGNATILNGVSGVMPPQSLVALMGPSGCG